MVCEMFMRTPYLALVLAASVALVVAGCGGGGSGPGSMTDVGPTMPDDGSTPQPPTMVPTRTQALADPTTAANLADAMTQAAQALPSAGSVTQSSNVDNGKFTTDRVQVTHRYSNEGGDGSIEVRNGTKWSITIDEENFRIIPDVDEPWIGFEASKRIEGGALYVDLYTDDDSEYSEYTTTVGADYDFTFPGIQVGDQYVNEGGSINFPAEFNGVPGRGACTGCSFVYTTGKLSMTGGSMTFTPDDGSAPTTLTPGATETITETVRDPDYLSGGIWMIVPDDAMSADDYAFGAFVDGNDPFRNNIAAVQGTASYDGDATGVYSDETGGSTHIGYFDGDVLLTANFGGGSDLGTIGGAITNFEVDGSPTDGRLDLGTASIGSANSGFFRGSVTGSDDEHSYTGHWGGQFFGNGEADGRPGSVAGTFGGNSTDDVVSFVGAFGAHKQ